MILTRQLAFRVGDFTLKGIDLEVEQGQYMVLLGPPGSAREAKREMGSCAQLPRFEQGGTFGSAT